MALQAGGEKVAVVCGGGRGVRGGGDVAKLWV